MPLFGEKRFRRADRQEITTKLSRTPPSAFTAAISKSKNKEVPVDYLIILANQIFGFNGWSHSVTHQTVDFVDFDGKKYNVGVTALVKVLLKDGTFHEDIGYGESRDLEHKGSSLAKARKIAANNALKNALSAFGRGLGCGLYRKDSPAGRLDAFLHPNQGFVSRSNATLSSVKRKLNSEFDAVSSQNSGVVRNTKQLHSAVESVTLTSSVSQGIPVEHSPIETYSVLSQPCSSSAVPKDILGFFSQVHHTPSFTSEDSLSSISPLLSQEKSNHQNTPDTQPCDSKTPVASSQSNVQLVTSPMNKEKVQRKLKQIELELKAREEARTNLLLQLRELDSDASSHSDVDSSLTKNEQQV